MSYTVRNIKLSEDELIALANMYITLSENQKQLEGCKDLLDESDEPGNLWEPLGPGMEVIGTLMKHMK